MDLAQNGVGHSLQSCEHCKWRKTKCDKVFPTCTTCRKTLQRCVYEDTTQSKLRKLRGQVDHFAKLLNSGSINTYLPTLGALNIDQSILYPIPSRWYMPFLLQHYQELIFPSFSRVQLSEKDSSPPTSWIQTSFSDPCMFHAVLLAASSHLDVIRREQDNPITHYHQHNTVRLLLDNISEYGKVPDTSIAATMYLWYYESMNCHTEEAEVHKSGLQQMVKSSGGLEKLGLDGFLARLITGIDISDAILNASLPAFADLASMPSPLVSVTLLSTSLTKPERELNTHSMPTPLLDLLRHVHESTLMFESQMLKDKLEVALASSSRQNILKHMSGVIYEDELLSPDGQEFPEFFHLACRCAATTHLRSLVQVIPFSSDENQKLIHQLGRSLSELAEGMWHETDPEIYIWLCFTGAAAAQEGKAWFLAKAEPVIMSLKPYEQQLFKLGVLQFCQLHRYLEELNI